MKYTVRITLKSGRWLEYNVNGEALEQVKSWYSEPNGVLQLSDEKLGKIEIRSNEAETISYKEIE